MSNSVADTAKQFNIPPSTVRSWQKQDPGFEGIGSPDPSPPAKKYSDEFINTVLKYIEVNGITSFLIRTDNLVVGSHRDGGSSILPGSPLHRVWVEQEVGEPRLRRVGGAEAGAGVCGDPHQQGDREQVQRPGLNFVQVEEGTKMEGK